jgi:hypothetical protein
MLIAFTTGFVLLALAFCGWKLIRFVRSRSKTLHGNGKSVIQSESIPAPFRYFIVAITFAVCGYFSAALFAPDFPEFHGITLFTPPIPFALVVMVLFFGRRDWGVLVALIPWTVGAWYLAYWIGLMADALSHEGSSLLPAGLAGFVGAAVLALGIAIFTDRLRPANPIRSAANLILAGVIGTISALPLGEAVTLAPRGIVRCGFAIWQAAVGTYLYAIYAGTSTEVRVALKSATGQRWRRP